MLRKSVNIVKMDALALLILVLLTVSVKLTMGSPEERALYRKLLQNKDSFDILARPVPNPHQPLVVHLGIDVQQLIDVNEKQQRMELNLWYHYTWYNYMFKWNDTEFSGITSVRIPINRMWIPDIILYNSVDHNSFDVYESHAVVSSDGKVEWIPPAVVQSSCAIDVRLYPFDTQKCSLQYSSWTHDDSKLDLVPREDAANIKEMKRNGEWDMIAFTVEYGKQTFDCCPENYSLLTFTLEIKRKSLFYVFNLVGPCTLISFMALLGFALPPDSGEKLTLEVTNFMSLVVFSIMVTDYLPSNSDVIPLIGIYFLVIMLNVTLSVVFTVIILNLHHRNPYTHTMPKWVRHLLLNWLPGILLMSRPGYAKQKFHFIRRSIGATSLEDDTEDDHPFIALSEMFANTASLFSSRRNSPTLNSSEKADKRNETSEAFCNHVGGVDQKTARSASQDKLVTSGPGFNALTKKRLSFVGPNAGSPTPSSNHLTVTLQPGKVSSDTFLGPADRSKVYNQITQLIEEEIMPVLTKINNQMQFMSKRQRKADQMIEIKNDWKFAASVLDRLALIIFSSLLAMATFMVLYVPHS